MGQWGEPKPVQGPPLKPMQVIRQMMWLGKLTDDDTIAAIRAATDPTIVFPDLTADETAALRTQARGMTANRLREWKRRGGESPTWLEVGALIEGLHRVFE